LNDGLKSDQTCRFEDHVLQKPVGASILPGPGRCRSEPRSGLLGLERSWYQWKKEETLALTSEKQAPKNTVKPRISNWQPSVGFGTVLKRIEYSLNPLPPDNEPKTALFADKSLRADQM
jgi:hypothetical protein